MRDSAANVAKDLNLTVAELQAVLWYAEQALYRSRSAVGEGFAGGLAQLPAFGARGRLTGPAGARAKSTVG